MLLTANKKLRKTLVDRVHDTDDDLLRFVKGLARSNPLICEPEEWTDRTSVIKCVPSAVGSRRAMNGRTTAIVVGRRDKLMMRHTCGGLLLAVGVMLDLVLLVERTCDFMRYTLEPFAALERALLEPLAQTVTDARRLMRLSSSGCCMPAFTRRT